nr:MAG TPA: hypothetical protein [Caudoviricetes sp.]
MLCAKLTFICGSQNTGTFLYTSDVCRGWEAVTAPAECSVESSAGAKEAYCTRHTKYYSLNHTSFLIFFLLLC